MCLFLSQGAVENTFEEQRLRTVISPLNSIKEIRNPSENRHLTIPTFALQPKNFSLRQFDFLQFNTS
jgi:hypothetical protein